MRHLGYTISGALRIVMDDGETLDIGPNAVFEVPPGHDKWASGDEPSASTGVAPVARNVPRSERRVSGLWRR